MSPTNNHQPPYFFLLFFRWFCKPALREDIEGDLYELFHKRSTKLGTVKAKWLFIKDVFLLFRPAIVNASGLLKFSWIKFMVLHLLVVLAILLPFIPGPPNKLVIGLSGFLQIAGFLGILLVPIGLSWTIIDIKNRKNRNSGVKLGKAPFYLALAATCIITFCSLILVIAVLTKEDIATGLIALSLIGVGFRSAIKGIKKLNKPVYRFNSAPFYLITIPLVAFFTRALLIAPVSEYSRGYAIKRSEQLILAIEEYKNTNGGYPPSIREIETYYNKKLPNPFVMGILSFRYNKINDGYSISFSQWLECGSLEEIVLYDKHNLRNNLAGPYSVYDYGFDLCRIKGAFATQPTNYDNWQYYHVD